MCHPCNYHGWLGFSHAWFGGVRCGKFQGHALESSCSELNLQSSNQLLVPEASLESSYGAHRDTQVRMKRLDLKGKPRWLSRPVDCTTLLSRDSSPAASNLGERVCDPSFGCFVLWSMESNWFVFIGQNFAPVITKRSDYVKLRYDQLCHLSCN